MPDKLVISFQRIVFGFVNVSPEDTSIFVRPTSPKTNFSHSNELFLCGIVELIRNGTVFTGIAMKIIAEPSVTDSGMCKKHLALLPCVLEQVSITCQNTLYARCDSLIIAGAGNEVFGKIVHIMVSKKQNNIIRMPLLELYDRA